MLDAYKVNQDALAEYLYGASPEFTEETRKASEFYIPLGKLIVNQDLNLVPAFQGHCEFEFNDEKYANCCVNFGMRYGLVENGVDDYSRIKDKFKEIKAIEVKECRGKTELIGKIRNDLEKKSCELKYLFQLEKIIQRGKEEKEKKETKEE